MGSEHRTSTGSWIEPSRARRLEVGLSRSQPYSSAANDGAIFRTSSSNALLKFGANGLMQSLDGSTFYSATPLRFSAKLTFKGGAVAPTVVAKYAPDGNDLTAKYESTGIFLFTWDNAQSDADYAVTVTLGSDGVGKPQSWSLYPYDVTKTYFRLEYSRNGSFANPAANIVAYVLVYRWA